LMLSDKQEHTALHAALKILQLWEPPELECSLILGSGRAT